MGLSCSKRVIQTLRRSPEFSSACADGYLDCLSLSQHAFAGVKRYQLLPAAERLHRTLSQSHTLRLISKWVPRPPDRAEVDRAEVDRALRAVLSSRATREEEGETTLDEAEFGEFAAEVFADAVVSGVRRELLKGLPIGAAGIAGFVAVVRPGKGVVAAAIGAYALGVATSVYLILGG